MANYLTPKETAQYMCKAGVTKANLPLKKFMLMAFLGGIFISLGGMLAVIVGGGMPGVLLENPGIQKFVFGAVFPVGLILVTLTGVDLFTSDCAMMTLPVLNKEVGVKSLVKVWVMSYAFNFLGSLFVAYFLAYQTGVVKSDPWASFLDGYAHAKVGNPFFKTFFKGIVANLLVCLASWQGYTAKDVTGRVVGIWLPVMAFVAMGMEHSVANMFFLPLAMFQGATVTAYDVVVTNLIPATLGNIVGGALFVGAFYWYIFLKEDVSSQEKQLAKQVEDILK